MLDQARAILRSVTVYCLFYGSWAFAGIDAELKPWESKLRVDHSWVGKVWSRRANTWISEQALIASLKGANYLLIGEKHDNPDHHQIQSLLLGRLVTSRSVVTFEMLQQQQTSMFDISATSLSELKSQLQWNQLNRGWPWEFYGPLVLRVLDGGADVVGAGFDKQELMQIYRGNIPEQYRDLMALDYSESLQQTLTEDLEISHCHKLPKTQIQPMVIIQRLRDLAMAKAMKRDFGEDGEQSILIAGNFHVRRDVGVPLYLDSLDPQKRIVSLSIQEVPAEVELLPMEDENTLYDFIWFTPAIVEKDYCADL